MSLKRCYEIIPPERQGMRKFIVVLVLILCFSHLVHGQKTRFGQSPEKPNPAEYSVKMHVSATHIRYYCSTDKDLYNECHRLFADVIVNGRRLEVSGATIIGKNKFALLVPGDYMARLTKDVNDETGAVINQEYDLLLSDSAIWHCVTTGIAE
jgi:hypothetical protein